jgi:hypothetical protein
MYSAGMMSLEAIKHVLELPELDEQLQKEAIYALYNMCEGEPGVAAHLQSPEMTEWLVGLADSPSFFVRRAIVQLFVAIDMRRPSSDRRTDLTRRVMDSIVDLIEGYRGEMLEALLERLIRIFRGAREAGELAVIDDFVRMGGIDALYVVFDDDSARKETRKGAKRLYDEFFNMGMTV